MWKTILDKGVYIHMKNHKSIDEMKNQLLQDIGEKRLSHSIRVAETGMVLGEKYDLDGEEIFLAGLLHDCGRLKNPQDLLNYADEFDIVLDDITRYCPELIHAPLGAKMAEKIYGVEDSDILNAIRYHTTGRRDMSILEKIIFISDYTEPMRRFKGVEGVRRLAPYDLDASIIIAMEESIKFLIEKDRLIHPNTIEGLNYLKLEIMKRGEKHIE